MNVNSLLKRRVVIIDNKDTASGIEFILNNSEKFKVIEVYSKGSDALAKTRADRPDIVLLELDLPVVYCHIG